MMEWINTWGSGYNMDFLQNTEIVISHTCSRDKKKYGSLKMRKSDNERTELHAHLFKRQRE